MVVVTSAGNSGPTVHHRLARHRRRRRSPSRPSIAPRLPGRDRHRRRRDDLRRSTRTAQAIPPIAGTSRCSTTIRQPGRGRALGCSGRRSAASLPAKDRRRQPRHVRARREGDLRPAGRRGGGRDGQQRDGLPAVRGSDHLEPRDGEPFTVTIPFLGVEGSGNDGDVGRREAAATPTHARRHVATRSRTRPSRLRAASRRAVRAPVTAGLKPDVTAPGVIDRLDRRRTGNGPRRSPAPRWRLRTSPAWRRSRARRIRRGRSRTSRRRS